MMVIENLPRNPLPPHTTILFFAAVAIVVECDVDFDSAIVVRRGYNTSNDRE